MRDSRKGIGGLMIAAGPLVLITYGLGLYDPAHPEPFVGGVLLINAIGFTLLMISWLDDA